MRPLVGKVTLFAKVAVGGLRLEKKISHFPYKFYSLGKSFTSEFIKIMVDYTVLGMKVTQFEDIVEVREHYLALLKLKYEMEADCGWTGRGLYHTELLPTVNSRLSRIESYCTMK